MYVRHERGPDLPPPVTQTGVIGWLKSNLFSSALNTLLTLLGLCLLALIVPPFARWAILDASWTGKSRADWDGLGACWIFIKVRFPLLMYGFFPEAERWRIDLTGLLFLGGGAPLVLAPFLPFSSRLKKAVLASIPLACCLGALLGMGFGPFALAALFLGAPFILVRLGQRPYLLLRGWENRLSRRLPAARLLFGLAAGLLAGCALQVSGLGASGPLGLAAGLLALLLGNISNPSTERWRFWLLYLIFPCLAWVLLLGGSLGLAPVGTDQWGGMFLSIVIALTGMAASLPIGVLIALGRTSAMPVLKALCIGFIELARGVPLISVLFMASVMLPMMLPEGMSFNKLLRAILGVSLFYAAYMAEVVRGGLAASPAGQHEAAESLGLRYWARMRLIVMPQALRMTIPAITNTFLGLMKDTTLVAVINLMDLLGIIKSALADPNWLGFSAEGYFFAGLSFWIFCFIVSRYSLYIESRLSRRRQ
jgi:general L-amino acid transport system permease protein